MLRIAQYKLAHGSHKDDDPDEDYCLVETAIIAAGFKHRPVIRPQDCPPCFSRVLVRYAVPLNDAMSSRLRNELLLPFVFRLAGTAACQEIESARARFIARQAQIHFGGMCPIIQHLLQKAIALATVNPLGSVGHTLRAIKLASSHDRHRSIWTIAVKILDGAIRLANSRPATSMSARNGPPAFPPIFPKPKRELEFS